MNYQLFYSVYNFIPCSNIFSVCVSSAILGDDYHQLSQIIDHFLKGKYKIKEFTVILKEHFKMQSYEYGPIKFRTMVQNISSILSQYCLEKLRLKQFSTITILITLFEQDCEMFFDVKIKEKLNLLHAINSLKTEQPSISLNKIKQIFSKQLYNLVQTIEGIAFYCLGNHNQAKQTLGKVISIIVTELFNKQIDQLSKCSINLYCICLYFCAESCKKQKQEEKASFYLTKCFQIAQKYLDQNEGLLSHIREMFPYQIAKTIKLGRIQNKINRASIYKANQNGFKLKINKNKNSSAVLDYSISKYKGKISHTKQTFKAIDKATQPNTLTTSFGITHKSKIKINSFSLHSQVIKINKNSHAKQNINKQLENLFIIKDKPPSLYQVKQKTLKVIQKQRLKLHKLGLKNDKLIQKIHEQAEQLKRQYKTNEMQQQIKKILTVQNKLQAQIRQQKWTVVHNLKATTNIEQYFKGFVTHITYLPLQKIHKYLFSEIGLTTMIFLAKIVKKFLSGKKRIKTIRCRYCFVLYQVQLISYRAKNGDQNPNYSILVYALQSHPSSINFQTLISIQILQRLQSQPFYYYFHEIGKKVIFFTQYLELIKNTKTFALVKRFIFRIKQRAFIKKGIIFQKKITHCLMIKNTLIQKMTFWISFEAEFIFVYRIDNFKISNKNYNMPICMQIKRNELWRKESNQLFQKQLNTNLLSYIDKKRKYESKIIFLQSNVRRALALKELKKLKCSMKCSSILKGNVLVSKIEKLNTRIVVERISKGEKQHKIMEVQKGLFLQPRFLSKIQAQLDCDYEWEKIVGLVTRHIHMHHLAHHILEKSKIVNLFPNQITRFKQKLIFSQRFSYYIYHRKRVSASVMFTLVTKGFEPLSQEYTLRVFTTNNRKVDASRTVTHSDKEYLEKHVKNITSIVHVLNKYCLEIVDTFDINQFFPSSQSVSQDNYTINIIDSSFQSFTKPQQTSAVGSISEIN